MDTNRLRQLAATALAFAAALDSWTQGAAIVASKLAGPSAAPVKASAKRAAAPVAAEAKPAKPATKKHAKRVSTAAKKRVEGKPQETVDNTEAVLAAIEAGHTTKAAIVAHTKASEGRVGLALIALRASGRVLMEGSKRGASYSSARSVPSHASLNGASAE